MSIGYTKDAIYIMSSCYGSKAIDPIAGEIEEPLDNNREYFASKCAEELGISKVPEEVLQYAIKYSDIPNPGQKDLYSAPNVIPSLGERSLCGMKCVYYREGLANFIGTDGHTYIIPANKVILKELEKCGYITMYEDQMSSDNEIRIGPIKESKKVDKNELRSKLTISMDLLDQMESEEKRFAFIQYSNITSPQLLSYTNPPSWVGYDYNAETKKYEPKYCYDVFSRYVKDTGMRQYIDPDFVYEFLGHDNPIAIKFKNMRTLGRDQLRVNDLESFKIYAENSLQNDKTEKIDYSEDAKFIMSSCYGTKAIDPIAGEIEETLDNNREYLAGKCAEELGISKIPEEVMQFAVKYSDIPNPGEKDMYSAPNVIPSLGERSLCGMKCVFFHSGLANFIGTDGHTYLIPANDILLNELEKCGYVSMYAGEISFDNKITIGSSQLKTVDKEDLRAKLTISMDLLEQMESEEKRNIDIEYDDNVNDLQLYHINPPSWVQYKYNGESRTYTPTYCYDVFSKNIKSGGSRQHIDPDYGYDFLGHDNPTAMKLKAMRELAQKKSDVNDLNSFIEYASTNKYLNGTALAQEQIMQQASIENSNKI